MTMGTLKDSRDLLRFIENKQSHHQMQLRRTDIIPDLNRESLLNLGAVLHYDEVIAGLAGKKRRIWHVAMPKSGSTWVTVTLKLILEERGWKSAFLLPAAGQREQEVVPAELMRQGKLDDDTFACQQHCLFSEYVGQMVQNYRYKVIIQVRNIADCMVSTLDHLNKDSVFGPIFFLDENQWKNFDDETKLNYVIDFVAPWYIKFWVGWSRFIAQHTNISMFIRYESILQNPEHEFARMLEFCGENPLDKEFDHQSKNHFTRKNIGIIGRGKRLPVWAHNRLKNLASYYPNTDFKPLGL